jgi:hypothetical protein
MPVIRINPFVVCNFRSDGYPSTMHIAEALFPEVAENLAEKIEDALNRPIELELTDDEAMCLAASMDLPRHQLPPDQADVIDEWYDRWLSTLPPVKCGRRGCTEDAVWCYYSNDVNHAVNEYRCQGHVGEYVRFAHRIRLEEKESVNG